MIEPESSSIVQGSTNDELRDTTVDGHILPCRCGAFACPAGLKPVLRRKETAHPRLLLIRFTAV